MSQIMDTNKLLDRARLMASKAKDGSLKIQGEVYTFTFDHTAWNYHVTDSKGETLGHFNFKSLGEAKKYVQWYLAN